MTLYSPTFLLAFLPLAATVYRITPMKLCTSVLALINLAFYFFAAGDNFYILPLLSLLVFLLAFLGKKGFFICIFLLVPLRMLGIFEIGISFFILRAAAYIYDEKKERNFFRLVAFLMFFPSVHAGPLTRYSHFASGFERRVDFEQMSRGICLLLYGAFKKLFFADTLYRAYSMFHTGGTSLSAALTLSAYALYIFFDFSGCSDIAVGAALLFGFDIPKNFDFPYMSRTVGEFFRRWHITLGKWLCDYIYIPLGGSRCGKPKTVMALLCVWLFSALWHGFTLSYLVWGMYFFLVLTAEKLLLPKGFKIGWLATVTLILLGWVFFFSETPADALSFFRRLFCLGDTLLYCRADLYNGIRYMPFLLLSVLFAAPLPRKLLSALYRRARALVYIGAPVVLLLILSCTAAGGHIPFLYASF